MGPCAPFLEQPTPIHDKSTDKHQTMLIVGSRFIRREKNQLSHSTTTKKTNRMVEQLFPYYHQAHIWGF